MVLDVLNKYNKKESSVQTSANSRFFWEIGGLRGILRTLCATCGLLEDLCFGTQDFHMGVVFFFYVLF